MLAWEFPSVFHEEPVLVLIYLPYYVISRSYDIISRQGQNFRYMGFVRCMDSLFITISLTPEISSLPYFEEFSLKIYRACLFACLSALSILVDSGYNGFRPISTTCSACDSDSKHSFE
jgi:hypothetical protein